jgi:hypothetical protein
MVHGTCHEARILAIARNPAELKGTALKRAQDVVTMSPGAGTSIQSGEVAEEEIYTVEVC